MCLAQHWHHTPLLKIPLWWRRAVLASLPLVLFFFRSIHWLAAAASQNEAEESDETEDEATGERTTRVGRPQGGMKVAGTENVGTITTVMFIESGHEEVENKLTMQQGRNSTIFLLGELPDGFTYEMMASSIGATLGITLTITSDFAAAGSSRSIHSSFRCPLSAIPTNPLAPPLVCVEKFTLQYLTLP